MTLEKKLKQQEVYPNWFTFKVATSTILLIELQTTQISPYISPCMHFIFSILPIHFLSKIGGEFEEWSILGRVTLGSVVENK